MDDFKREPIFRGVVRKQVELVTPRSRIYWDLKNMIRALFGDLWLGRLIDLQRAAIGNRSRIREDWLKVRTPG